MKAFRLPGPLEDESLRLARLFALGCVGAAEVEGEAGPEVVAYFREALPLPFRGAWEDVDEVDYVAAYRRSLRPVRVGPLVVAPTHRRARLSAGEQVVWLDPGAAFGTGHHQSTRLALAALLRRDLVGRSVLDVGTGSGILAIAADRLGGARVRGLDTDAGAVAVARANARLNRSRAVFCVGGPDRAEQDTRYDVIVANLHAELHAELMSAYLAVAAPGGVLLLAGILTRLEGQVRDAVPEGCMVEGWRDGAWTLLEVGVPAAEGGGT